MFNEDLPLGKKNLFFGNDVSTKWDTESCPVKLRQGARQNILPVKEKKGKTSENYHKELPEIKSQMKTKKHTKISAAVRKITIRPPKCCKTYVAVLVILCLNLPISVLAQNVTGTMTRTHGSNGTIWITCKFKLICQTASWFVRNQGKDTVTLVARENTTFSNSTKYSAKMKNDNSWTVYSLKVTMVDTKDLTAAYRCDCDNVSIEKDFSDLAGQQTSSSSSRIQRYHCIVFLWMFFLKTLF